MKIIDLFAGIGGFRLGLENANRYGLERCNQTIGTKAGGQIDYEETCADPDRKQAGGHTTLTCVWSNEWDKYASSIYRYHWGECDTGDIRTVDASEIPDHDLLVAGFPCQAFSIAGKRRGFDDTRGTLFFEIARILQAKQPRLCLLENVKGLLSHDSGRTFKTIIATLTELGYDCQWKVLNSKNFGVPQNRERIFIVGNLRGTTRPEVFPFGQDGQLSEGKGQTNKRQTQTRYSRTLKGSNIKADHTFIQETQKLSDAMRVRMIDGVSSTLKGLGGGMGAKTGLYAVRKNNGKIEKTEDEALYIDRNYHKGFDNHGQRTGITDGLQIRRLTPVECERLQGFPDNFTKYGIDGNGKKVEISDSQRYKCLGNAVTTTVVTYLGKRL